MRHAIFPPRDAWHPLGCRCPECVPPGPADVALRPSLARATIAGALGFASGVAIAFAIDPAGTAGVITGAVAWAFAS